jgi:hypothetical protein
MSSNPPAHILKLSDRLYRRLLTAYPAAYRREYGALLVQLCRDQCRDAYRRGGNFGVASLWPHLLFDLIESSAHEQLTQLERNAIMNKLANPQLLSMILLGTGLITGAMTFVCFGTPMAGVACAYIASAAILSKGILEWFRPRVDWWKGMLTGLVIAVAYGFFMPEWARLRQEYGLTHLIQPPLLMLPILVNLAVPLIQGLLTRMPGRDPKTS